MICKYYSKAKCRNFDSCKFEHVLDGNSEQALKPSGQPADYTPLKVHRIRHPPNPFIKASEILEALKSLNPLQKIITYWGLASTGVDRVPMIYSGNFDMDCGYVKSTTEIELLIRFDPCLRSGGVLKIAIREFTGILEENTKVPLKNLYAYQSCNGGGLERLCASESQFFHQQISKIPNEAYAKYC